MNKNLVLGLLLATFAPALATEAPSAVEVTEATRSVEVQEPAQKKVEAADEATRLVEVQEAPVAAVVQSDEAQATRAPEVDTATVA